MKKYFFRAALIFSPLFICFVGPWPISDTHYLEMDYAKSTLHHIDKLTPVHHTGQLTGAVSVVDITPPVGVELAGYSARAPKSNEGVLHKVYVKAISLSDGNNLITFVSPEILLPMPQLVDNIIKTTGLNRNEVFFAATHTHSGPGAYAKGFISEMALGNYNQEQFKFLSEKISNAIIESRKNLVAVEAKYRRIHLTEEYANQFIKDQLNTPPQPHNIIQLLELHELASDSRMAALFTFSAHPTFLGRRNKMVSGDYPGVVMQALEQQFQGAMIFASGAAGGMLPIGENNSANLNADEQFEKMHDMSQRFIQLFSGFLKKPAIYDDQKIQHVEQWDTSQTTLQSEFIPVELPNASYRLNDHLRLSPLLVQQIFHNDKSYIQAFRLGNIIFLGYPADYSGELARNLEHWAGERNIYPWATSFNGDYIGYIMPTHHYDKSHYTVRSVNFYGRWAGDYFTDISQRTINKLYSNE